MWHLMDLIVIFHFRLFFTLLPPQQPKKSKFWKSEKTPGGFIILQKCTKNHDHMLHHSWDMVCDRCNYFSFCAIFCPFTAQKNQNFTKMKKIPGDIIISHKCTKTYDQMMYGSWDMVHDRCNWYFSFWAILCSNQNFEKNEKMARRYHHFTYV